VRGQDPIWTFQAHVGYNFGPNFWLAADTIYYTGGRTSLLPGAKLTFAALWSIALGKTKPAGLTGGAH
jgi:hypothetical protein